MSEDARKRNQTMEIEIEAVEPRLKGEGLKVDEMLRGHNKEIVQEFSPLSFLGSFLPRGRCYQNGCIRLQKEAK